MKKYCPVKHFRIYGLFGLLLIFHTTANAIAEDAEIWIMVDTQTAILAVMEGEESKQVFKNISLGRNGAGYKLRRGDDTTPLGRYRIGWINDKSRYHRFFGMTYPSPADAARAYRAGKINTDTLKSLVKAGQNKQIPSQKTILGGQIGIHGIGSGSHLAPALSPSMADRVSQSVVGKPKNSRRDSRGQECRANSFAIR